MGVSLDGFGSKTDRIPRGFATDAPWRAWVAAFCTSNAVGVPGNAVDAPGNAVDVPGNAVDAPSNAVDVPSDAIDVRAG